MIEPTARTEAARTAIMFSGLSGNMKLSKKASRRRWLAINPKRAKRRALPTPR